MTVLTCRVCGWELSADNELLDMVCGSWLGCTGAALRWGRELGVLPSMSEANIPAEALWSSPEWAVCVDAWIEAGAPGSRGGK
jgi:hypothetical protein